MYFRLRQEHVVLELWILVFVMSLHFLNHIENIIDEVLRILHFGADVQVLLRKHHLLNLMKRGVHAMSGLNCVTTCGDVGVVVNA